MTPQYPDIPFIGPPRSYNATSYAKRYVVIHNTSNNASARGEAGYAMRRTDGTSSHYYQDRIELIQSLPTIYGANHVGSSMGNRYGIAYEITGVNGWSRAQWLANVAWPLISRQIARDMVRHRIPAQLLTVAQMRQGTPGGMVTHDQCRQAWGGTDHTDPGPNFPLDYLLALVQQQLAGPAPAPALEDDMRWFADADREYPGKGLFWLGDAHDKQLVTAGQKATITQVASVVDPLSGLVTAPGGILLKPGQVGPAAAQVRGNCDGMGPQLGALTDAQVDQIVAGVVPPLVEAIEGLPVSGLTAEQIEAACRRGVTGLALG